MKNLFILLVTIICISCSDNNTLPKQTGTTFGASVYVSLKNSEGINIFDTDKYPERNISIRYLIGGKEFYYGYDTPYAILDNPGGFFIVNLSETGKGMSVFLNHDSSEKYPITYIYWNATDVDTIKAQYRRAKNSTILEKAWLFKNNDWQVAAPPYITIVK
jgi:hypothetical protein